MPLATSFPTPIPTPAPAAPAAPMQAVPQAAVPPQAQPRELSPVVAKYTAPDGAPSDPSLVKFAQALRNAESQGNFSAVGDGGRSAGAYQWNNGQQPLAPGQVPQNFQNGAKQFGLDPTDFSPANQNRVAYYQLAAMKEKGYAPWQAASAWNSGSPDNYVNHAGTNAQGIRYDTPAYVAKVVSQLGIDPSSYGGSAAPAAPQQPSLGGFAGNLVKSGANFAGNLGSAILHPIQTVQGIGSAAVGGLQELGGQQNGNTQNFDNVVNFFKQRYGSVDDLKNTIYTDPVGFAADLSTVLTGGGSLIGKAGEIGGVADASRAADLALSTGTRTMAGDLASGNAATRAGSAISAAGEAVNPLTPIVAGAASLASPAAKFAASKLTGLEPETISAIQEDPEAFTADQIANASRTTLAKQVEGALGDRISSLEDTGSAYGGIRSASDATIPVAKNFLETQLRGAAGVDVTDGEIAAKGSSAVRAPKDVRALQSLYDTWKPEFQKGYLTNEEFLNFRSDLAGAAKFDREFSSSKPVEGVAAAMRKSFNDAYRSKVPGLEALDAKFSGEKASLDELRKGLIGKDGSLTDSAINKIANAAGNGKDAQLARLEQLVPGITKKLQIQKAIEDIQKASGNKVGTYTRSATETGSVLLGLSSGNVAMVAAGLVTAIVSSPGVAVPLLKAFNFDKALVSQVSAKLAKYATIGAVGNAATGSPAAPGTDTQTPAGSPPGQTASSGQNTTP